MEKKIGIYIGDELIGVSIESCDTPEITETSKDSPKWESTIKDSEAVQDYIKGLNIDSNE